MALFEWRDYQLESFCKLHHYYMTFRYSFTLKPRQQRKLLNYLLLLTFFSPKSTKHDLHAFPLLKYFRRILKLKIKKWKYKMKITSLPLHKNKISLTILLNIGANHQRIRFFLNIRYWSTLSLKLVKIFKLSYWVHIMRMFS